MATLDFEFMFGQQAKKPGIIESSVRRLQVTLGLACGRCIARENGLPMLAGNC